MKKEENGKGLRRGAMDAKEMGWEWKRKERSG